MKVWKQIKKNEEGSQREREVERDGGGKKEEEIGRRRRNSYIRGCIVLLSLTTHKQPRKQGQVRDRCNKGVSLSLSEADLAASPYLSTLPEGDNDCDSEVRKNTRDTHTYETSLQLDILRTISYYILTLSRPCHRRL